MKLWALRAVLPWYSQSRCDQLPGEGSLELDGDLVWSWRGTSVSGPAARTGRPRNARRAQVGEQLLLPGVWAPLGKLISI